MTKIPGIFYYKYHPNCTLILFVVIANVILFVFVVLLVLLS